MIFNEIDGYGNIVISDLNSHHHVDNRKQVPIHLLKCCYLSKILSKDLRVERRECEEFKSEVVSLKKVILSSNKTIELELWLNFPSLGTIAQRD